MKLRKLIIGFAMAGSIAAVGPMQVLASSSSEIREQIDSYLADLEASRQRSDELEEEIASLQTEVGELFAEVAALDIEREAYYEDMKTRMAYFYEEMQGRSLLSYLFGADSFAEFINRVQFQQSLYTYDEEQLAGYCGLVEDLEEKQEDLDGRIEALGDMVEEQVILQAALDVLISDKETEFDEAKAAEAAAAAAAAAQEEAAKRAETDAVVYAMSLTTDVEESDTSDTSPSSDEASSKSDNVSSSPAASSSKPAESSSSDDASSLRETSSSSGRTSFSSEGSGSSSSGSYDMPSGDGVLTKEKGVNYYNGHIETWYSQRDLPGVGLDIPGRYVDSRGIICDIDGYICVASSDYPKGTIVETSLGLAKVYDSGCASGVIDIYTDW